jgi:hypothetical protein
MPMSSPTLKLKHKTIVGDQPPHDLHANPVPDGVHLRWSHSKPSARGQQQILPWHGFYLLRRQAVADVYECMAPDLARWPLGQSVSRQFLSSIARVEGVEPLLFTDDFFPLGSPEIAFGHDKTLDIYPHETARRVRIRVGARTEGTMTCAHFMQLPAGNGPNPRVENGMTFTTLAANGNPSPQAPLVVADGLTGLGCDQQVDVLLPCPSGLVSICATSGNGPRTVNGLNAAGIIVATETLPGVVPQELVELVGTDMVSVQIKCPGNELAIHWLCHQCGPAQEFHVTASGYEHGSPATELIASTWPGGRVVLNLTGSAFERVTLRTNLPAALIDFCVVSTDQNETVDWEPVPDAPAPFCLPVHATGYPCRGAPVTYTAAIDTAHARLRHTAPVDWPSARFAQLHDRLVALATGGPLATPMEDRTAPFTANQQDGPALLNIQEINLLQMLLLTTVDPSVAQMLGLYWIDQSADP